MFSYFKTMLFYLKRAESGQTSLWLTVIGCSGQSSYYYLAFLLQGRIGFERERVFDSAEAAKRRSDQDLRDYYSVYLFSISI